MADKVTPPNDLTSTLNLRQLRALPKSVIASDLYKSLTDEQKNVIENLPKGEAIFLVLKGAGLGSRFLLDSPEIKIGREDSNQIVLDDITVSRSHALISKSGGYSIKDLGSLNGTYINAVAIKEAQINAGDEIQIGKFHMTFFVGDK